MTILARGLIKNVRRNIVIIIFNFVKNIFFTENKFNLISIGIMLKYLKNSILFFRLLMKKLVLTLENKHCTLY